MSLTPHIYGTPAPGYVGKKRCLVFPGGGMRTAYQAGAARALIESGLVFTHMDGTSGGSINMSMLLSGISPSEMSARWSSLPIRDFVSFLPLQEYLSSPQWPAFGSHKGVAEKVLPHLGVDLDQVRNADGVDAVYNVLNFSRKMVKVIPHRAIQLDMMLAGMSLPIAMPAIESEGEWFCDPAFIRDANLVEAVRRGAEELWVLWVIGNTPVYKNGAFNQYVHMLEIAANGALFADLERISEMNERIRGGETIWGHTQPIRVHVIRPAHALPLDSELYLGRINAATLVGMGYSDAKRYMSTMNPEGTPLNSDATRMPPEKLGFTFREMMEGPFAWEATDPKLGAAEGEKVCTKLTMRATISIYDLDRFLAEANHPGSMVGEIDFKPLGMAMPSTQGVFNLFSPSDDPTLKYMVYELGFESGGKPYYMAGKKLVRQHSVLDLWKDTTTLYTRLHEGTDATGPVVGAGVLSLSMPELVKMIPTMHALNAQTPKEELEAVSRFGKFFLGELWQTYVKK
jgi:predicted acylesterase/phospholipase RssA